MNLKKCTTVFLVFLMLFSNTGLAFNVHYCGDEIASISLKTNKIIQSFETNCCGIVEEQSNCCNDKSFQFQENSDKFQKEINSFEFSKIASVFYKKCSISSLATNFKIAKTAVVYFHKNNLPPIYKRNCQLIFYA